MNVFELFLAKEKTLKAAEDTKKAVDKKHREEFNALSDTYPVEPVCCLNYSLPYETGINHAVKIDAQRNSAENDSENMYNIIICDGTSTITLPVSFVENFACKLLEVYDEYAEKHLPVNVWSGKK